MGMKLGRRSALVALDEHRRGGGDLGEVAEAVGVEDTVAVSNVARVHKGLVGIDNGGQAVHRASSSVYSTPAMRSEAEDAAE